MTLEFKNVKRGEFEVSESEKSYFESDQGHLNWIIPELSEENSNASLIMNFQSKVSESDIFPINI